MITFSQMMRHSSGWLRLAVNAGGAKRADNPEEPADKGQFPHRRHTISTGRWLHASSTPVDISLCEGGHVSLNQWMLESWRREM
ncbi:hypothetical protein DVH07_18540 [Hafnia paralvei]|uniref:hypothetical protein n=1 Tax=Hafnia paralvei TaxID=546367 RepID=UPI000DF30A9B|nr:hypothetical protein [Hafnia paralvei]RDA61934.1 hypothetical protein DU449_18100 [Hafnia paralvei]RDA62994.1 hypothetical protein DVH08_20310 [Hafnia paralvei]RDA63834.1 hypothetical protein DVH09_18670 [Hafnia paralvei]RDA75120.1 hypothetical protein DVH10_17840 [Hafnia paralvei]RDA75525.1 hypothetical protein DVH07_18540 [Hafnia paralvei]